MDNQDELNLKQAKALLDWAIKKGLPDKTIQEIIEIERELYAKQPNV